MLLFTIINPKDLKAELFIPSDQLTEIHLNQPVTASSLADSTKTINGTITHISPVINPESGTCRALAIFPGAGRSRDVLHRTPEQAVGMDGGKLRFYKLGRALD